jgi:copper chaperone
MIVVGMNCSHSVQSVTKAVKAVDPQADVRINLAGKTVEADTSADRDTVAKAIAAAGYAIVA